MKKFLVTIITFLVLATSANAAVEIKGTGCSYVSAEVSSVEEIIETREILEEVGIDCTVGKVEEFFGGMKTAIDSARELLFTNCYSIFIMQETGLTKGNIYYVLVDHDHDEVVVYFYHYDTIKDAKAFVDLVTGE